MSVFMLQSYNTNRYIKASGVKWLRKGWSKAKSIYEIFCLYVTFPLSDIISLILMMMPFRNMTECCDPPTRPFV